MSAPAKVSFQRSGAFFAELKRRVGDYFEEQRLDPRDRPAMYLKTGLILAWLAASYLLLLFWASTWWEVLPLAISTGLAMVGVGFNIQHDGGHGAYSNHRWVNQVMAHSMDAIGGSSWIWHQKHNILHHTYVNIADVDTDIDMGLLGRLAPSHRWRPFYRFQHIYLWPLYGLISLKWTLVDDFRNLISGRLGKHALSRPSPLRLTGILAMKLVYVSWALVIPLLLRPWTGVLFAFLVATLTAGFVLSIVFQLAHTVEGAEFPLPDEDSRMSQDWAVHQLRTTVDFARKNRPLTWFLGGLNFQIEHHLFPRVCHVHFPALSRIVEATCADFGVPYRAYPTARRAIRAHARWLRKMGRPEPVAAQA